MPNWGIERGFCNQGTRGRVLFYFFIAKGKKTFSFVSNITKVKLQAPTVAKRDTVSANAMREMTTIKYKDWEFIVDKTLTKQTYDKIKFGGPESCGCNDCKNFANNRNKIYPEEIKQLLTDLGVDYRKENEICHYCKLDNGLHFYGGWFHFKGTFIGKNCSTQLDGGGSTIELTPITDNFSLGFHFSNSLAFFEDTTNLVQIEFDAKTP